MFSGFVFSLYTLYMYETPWKLKYYVHFLTLAFNCYLNLLAESKWKVFKGEARTGYHSPMQRKKHHIHPLPSNELL